MEYPKKRRREAYWDLPPEHTSFDENGSPLDEAGELIKKKTRMVERLEWISRDGRRFRSLSPDILDRRRWAEMSPEAVKEELDERRREREG